MNSWAKTTMTRVSGAISIITGMAGFLTWGSVPTLPSFAKQSANLWDLKRRIQDHIAWQIGALEDSIHLVDGFPMPVCKYARASGSRCFKGEAGFSYCAAKDEKYYGFEGHVLISFEGIICGYALTAANVDERDVLPEMVVGLHGLLIGDKGYFVPA